MSELWVARRFFVLFVVAGGLCTCAADQPSPMALRGAADGAGPCADGKGKDNRQAPIVCVDDTGAALTVSPEPIILDAKLRGKGGAVTLQWFTRSGGNDLQVSVKDGCVTDVKCDGKGHCTAKAKDVDAETRCKYDVWTNKHPRLDPEVVIQPCC